GLLPRLVLLLLCLWRWRRGTARLQLDSGLPDYELLRERLQPGSERLGISDAAPAQLPTTAADDAALEGAGAVLLGLELDRPWPPTLAAGIADAGVIDSREQRRRLLEQLSRCPPARLVIACDPRRSPDRGTLALLAELARSSASTRIWLLPPPPGEGLDSERLGDWHAALERAQLAYRDSAPLAWLETGHE
ncbi:MAG: DUF2868 domain-containing protein, partial [Pseudomonadota bacterium]